MVERKYLGYSLALAMIAVVAQVISILAVPTLVLPASMYTFLPLATFGISLAVASRISKSRKLEAFK